MNKGIITQLNKRRQSLQSLIKFADAKLTSILDEKNKLTEEYDVIEKLLVFYEQKNEKLLVFYEQQKPGMQIGLDMIDQTEEVNEAIIITEDVK